MAINSFTSVKRTLMGPGPSDVSSRVLQALSQHTLGHLDPLFVAMMDETKELLQYAFQTQNQLTIPVSAPGSAGMETVFFNLLEPGDSVVICQNGVFGGRMKEVAARCGAVVISVDDEWGDAVDPDKLEAALKQNPDAKAVAFVHSETSTGVLSDAAQLCQLAKKYGCLTIVDSVTSLAGVPFLVDEWHVDATYSGTQKCLSVPPGISPVSFSEQAKQVIANRNSKVQSWFLDLNLVMGYWGEGARSYHHTAPVNALYGLHEGLVILQEEGLENSWARHERMHVALKAGFQAMGLEFAVNEAIQLPQLNAIKIPEGVDDAVVRGKLLAEYNLEIGAGLGKFAGNVWRIGLMGQSACEENVIYCLSAMESVLAEMNAPIKTVVAVSAAQSSLS